MSARNRPSDVGHCGGLGADDKGCGARLSRGARQLFFAGSGVAWTGICIMQAGFAARALCLPGPPALNTPHSNNRIEQDE
ncbi:hypothetical protein C4K27_4774 [Pseudomonas chlororaphis subsp. chlororaphis]|nr:hypothetical protein C4K27_4774 [Pseudomonas chlororaphis subsp. chlororaphis]